MPIVDLLRDLVRPGPHDRLVVARHDRGHRGSPGTGADDGDLRLTALRAHLGTGMVLTGIAFTGRADRRRVMPSSLLQDRWLCTPRVGWSRAFAEVVRCDRSLSRAGSGFRCCRVIWLPRGRWLAVPLGPSRLLLVPLGLPLGPRRFSWSSPLLLVLAAPLGPRRFSRSSPLLGPRRSSWSSPLLLVLAGSSWSSPAPLGPRRSSWFLAAPLGPGIENCPKGLCPARWPTYPEDWCPQAHFRRM